jgi:SEC-C motif domain protein
MSACACGSGRDFLECCAPALDGSRPPQTPEALMRSRYTAFTQGDAAYLEATHDAPREPGGRMALAAWARIVTWLGLEVQDAPPAQGEEGEVAFVARYLEDGALVVLSERSRFHRKDGRWLYRDGKASTVRTKVSRNGPCPCGSGVKFKACHG